MSISRVWTELSCDTLIDSSKDPDETDTELVPRKRPPPPTEEQPPASIAAGSDEGNIVLLNALSCSMFRSLFRMVLVDEEEVSCKADEIVGRFARESNSIVEK